MSTAYTSMEKKEKYHYTWNLFRRQFQIQDGLKLDLKSLVSKQKCIDYIEKMTIYVIYTFLYTYVYIYSVHFCLDTTQLFS